MATTNVTVIGGSYKGQAAPPGQVYVRDNATGTILLRPANNPTGAAQNDFDAFVSGIGQEEMMPILDLTRDRLGEAFGDVEGAFEFSPLADFRDEATSLADQFFDPELQLVNKTFEVAKQRAKEDKEKTLRRQYEDRDRFFQTEDIDFSRALEAAQSGFSGRETFRSGFRREAVNEMTDDQGRREDLAMEQWRRAHLDTVEDFDRFMETTGLEEKETRLNIDRRKEDKVLATQQLLQQEEQNKKLAKQSDISDFIRQRLG